MSDKNTLFNTIRNSLFSKATKQLRKARFMPRLERCEERVVPATYTWNSATTTLAVTFVAGDSGITSLKIYESGGTVEIDTSAGNVLTITPESGGTNDVSPPAGEITTITISTSAYTDQNLSIDLSALTASFTALTSITLSANATKTNTLTAPNDSGATSTFTVSGANSGSGTIANLFNKITSSSLTFANINAIVAGDGDDTFIIGAGSLSGTITGGSGDNSLSFVGNAAGVSVNLTTGAATDTGGVTDIGNFTSFTGTDDATDTLTYVGSSDDFKWTITDANDGTIDNETTVSTPITFTNFGKLIGGSGNDTFKFEASGTASLSGTIDGGADGTDTLDYVDWEAAVSVNLSASSATGIVNTGSTLTANTASGTGGLAAGTIDNVTGENGNFVNFLVGSTGVNVLIGGSGADELWTGGGADTLTGREGNDYYVIDDAGTAGTVTLNEAGGTSDTINFSQFDGAISSTSTPLNLDSAASQTFQGPWNIVLNTGGYENYVGAPGNNFIRLSPSGNARSITMGAGNDEITVYTDVSSITTAGYASFLTNLATVTIQSSTGTNVLNVDESANTAANAVVINDQSIVGSVTANYTIAYTKDGTDDFAGAVNVTTGSGNDGIAIRSTIDNATTTVNGAAGNDSFTVGGTDNKLTAIDNTLTILGGSGSNVLTINGGGETTTAYATTITSSAITDSSGIFTTINYSATGTFAGGIRFTSGSKDDVVTVQSTLTSSPTIVTTGSGADTVNVGNSNSLAGLAAALTVNMGANTNDKLNISDSARSADTNWTVASTALTSSSTGAVSAINYSGIKEFSFNASGGNNQITFSSVQTGAKYTVDGGSGTDKLTALNRTNAWSITGSGAGNVNGTSALNFSSFEDLTGGTGNDTFTFTNTFEVTGTIAGGTGTDTLNYGAYTSARDITVNGAGAGNRASSSLPFTGIENITGGTVEDQFHFSTAGSISGVLNGGGATNGDTLDYTSYSSGVTVNLANAVATGVNGGLSSTTTIRHIIGSANADTLTGNSLANLINGLAGSDVIGGGGGNDVLIGGSGSDTIVSTSTATQGVALLNGNAAASIANQIAALIAWSGSDFGSAARTALLGNGATGVDHSDDSDADTLIGSTLAFNFFDRSSTDSVRNYKSTDVIG